ncbi:hypothetical protein WMY93_030901 [Mugilogobius chulae]|uniref:Uncharacterized protein n=1 Tax=Mugilogobius chulae TaxID=88201 RepID=A0AAW0MJY6_9GOBI
MLHHGPNLQSGLFQHYHHHHCHGLPPPLPHASQSLSIHPFHSPQLPLCSALAGYGYSTLPTHLAHANRAKSPGPKDSKKSPSKVKARGNRSQQSDETFKSNMSILTRIREVWAKRATVDWSDVKAGNWHMNRTHLAVSVQERLSNAFLYRLDFHLTDRNGLKIMV